MDEAFQKKVDKLRERVIAEVMRNGGSTGSNMAEPLWFRPGPVKIPDGLSPEESARRKQRSEELRKAIDEYCAHVDAAKKNKH